MKAAEIIKQEIASATNDMVNILDGNYDGRNLIDLISPSSPDQGFVCLYNRIVKFLFNKKGKPTPQYKTMMLKYIYALTRHCSDSEIADKIITNIETTTTPAIAKTVWANATQQEIDEIIEFQQKHDEQN
jgi:hypothetical protein